MAPTHILRPVRRDPSVNNQYEEALLPPAPDVLPWDEYKETVSSTLQKRLGHRKVEMHGHTVVVMPPKKGTPWKLQPKFAFQLDNTERVHDQNSSDSEDECGAMFEEMAQDHTEQLADVTKKASTFEEMLAAVAAAEKNNPSVGSSGFGSADLALCFVV